MATLQRVLRNVRGVRPRVRIPAAPGGGEASYPTAETLTGGPETVPNFAKNADILSAQDGDWSSTSTWEGGTLPQAGDIVGIRHTVTYDVDAVTEYEAVGIAGTLAFATDADTQLWTQHLLIYEGGTLTVGTEASPVGSSFTAEIVITDVAIDTGTVESPGADPAQHGNGLICFGNCEMHGAVKTRYRRLASTASATDTSLTLNSAPSGWAVGDEVVIADSRLLNDPNDANKWKLERTTIASISDTTLGIDDGLLVDRPQAVDGDGVAEAGMTAHVGNLSCNVIIRSENPAGTRGHVIFLDPSPTIDIRYVRFKGLGRTTHDALDSATFDNDGNPTHIGTNQVGRYPLHFHHLHGMSNYRFRVVGCTFDPGQDTEHGIKWAVAVHETNYGLMDNCLFWNWAGAAVSIESGAERENLFQNNVIIFVNGAGFGRADSGFPGREGDGFWSTGTARNRFVNNSCCGCEMHGWTFFGDTQNPGGFLEFDGNEVYGGRNGITWWEINGADTGLANPAAATTKVLNFTVWHCWEGGTNLLYPGYGITIENLKVRLGTNTNPIGYGHQNGDYRTRNNHIVNPDIQNCFVGINMPVIDGDGTVEFTITGGYLKNFINLKVETVATPGGGGWIPQGRLVEVTDTEMDPLANAGLTSQHGHSAYNVFLEYRTNQNNTYLMIPNEIRFTNYNGVTDDNIRVYFNEQDADQVVPQSSSSPNVIACPEAGLTNAQCWAKYEPWTPEYTGFNIPVKSDAPNPNTPGLAIAGSVAPEGVTTREDIFGLVEEL